MCVALELLVERVSQLGKKYNNIKTYLKVALIFFVVDAEIQWSCS